MPNSSRLRTLTSTALAFCLLVLEATSKPCLADSGQTAFTADHKSHPGKLVGDAPATLRFVTRDAGEIPLAEVRRIDCPARANVLSTAGPARLVRLWGREQLVGEVLEWNADGTVIGALDGAVRRLPRSAIAGVLSLPSEADAIYEAFEQPPTAWQTTASRLNLDRAQHRSGESSLLVDSDMPDLTYRLPQPLEAGRIRLWYWEGESTSSGGGAIELEFAGKDGPHTLRCAWLTGEDAPRVVSSVSLPMSVQSLRRRSGWHQLTVVLRPRGLQVLIDGSMLAVAREPMGALTAVRLSAAAASEKADESASHDGQFRVDDFAISRFVARDDVSAPPAAQDVVATTDGQFYGRVTQVDATWVLLAGAFGTIGLDWSEVQAVLPSLGSLEPVTVSGWLARVELQRLDDVAGDARQVLIGALQSADAERIVLEHPWLGALSLPTRLVRRIEPQFHGASLMLAPQTQHLGDEVRERYHAPIPQEHVEQHFELAEVIPGEAFFAADVAELEPAGPGTPPASPFLSELRGGFLATTLRVNGIHLGTLNEQIVSRRSPDAPERIRIRLPPGLLEPGQNSYRLEQRPSAQPPYNRDDFEISRIAIEFETQ